MLFIEESNLKHILKTKQINQKQNKIYLRNRLIKHGFTLKVTTILKHLQKLQITKSIKKIAHIKP